MKFMKLGSRPDTFYTTETVRSISSEVSSDLIIQVKGSRYLLHKFPLLSKCGRLQKLCSESPEASHSVQAVQLPDFPGGAEAFELCAKFCYGITITLSAYNIVSMRCASEYLQMSEEVERGNLAQKLEAFFTSCLLQGWRDTIVALQSTKSNPAWSEGLKITGRCVEALASKVSARPVKADLSRSYSRKGRRDDDGSSEGRRHGPRSSKPASSGGKGWWAEDLAELGIDLYWRTMIAIKARGVVRANLIGDALRVYASHWLPNVSKRMKKGGEYDEDGEVDNGETTTASKHILLLESIVSLLPPEKGAVSCGFLSKLLKASNALGSSPSTRTELAKRIGLQLDEAAVNDLLIPNPNRTPGATKDDVDVVTTILEQFASQSQSPPTSPTRIKGDYYERRRSRSAENIDSELQGSRRSSSASHGSKLKVAKLVDRYLQEIAKDKNLPLSKFTSIAEQIPEFARLDHDDLYKAIDTYLKVHPELNKSERKALCRALDCKKLSVEACMHAAQNEMLPLRVVVQVLFFEQARAATTNGGKAADFPGNIKALLVASSQRKGGPTGASSVVPEDDRTSQVSTLKMKLAENDDDEDGEGDGAGGFNRSKTLSTTVPKRMFSRLWPRINRSVSEKA